MIMIEQFKDAIANILIVILCLGMTGAGMIKLLGLETVVAVFEAWSLPVWARYVVGSIELVIGLCIFIPQARKYALMALILEMIGAFTLHLAYEQFWDTRGPALIILASLVLLYLKREFPFDGYTSK